MKSEQFTWPCSGPLPSLKTFGMSIFDSPLSKFSSGPLMKRHLHLVLHRSHMN
jgi:hypothetical protein